MSLLSPLDPDYHQDRKVQEKHRKKFNAALRNAIICLGMGLGMILVKALFIGTISTESGENAAAMLKSIGLILCGYGVFIILCGIFLKKQMPFINFIAFWFILPSFIIKVLMEGL